MHITRAEMDDLVEREAAKAASAANGRSAVAVLKDGRLRHTLITLTAGSRLSEHPKPESATLLVLRGRIVVSWEGNSASIAHGGLFVLPDALHDVAAEEDSSFLLTTIAG
ncbi:cupin [Paeniglutamicibacter sp. R2-26]|uniref:cupin n=1 Tax=Paeniglutamicibacter sp. R2-26 TaxID=3144417 RepID=UPI003EE6DBF7